MKRKFSQDKALHVVLRSRSFTLRHRRNLKIIGDILYLYAERFHIKVYQNSVNSNHIHLLLRAKSKSDLQSFLRVVSGQIAQQVTHAVKGKTLSLSFWLKAIWSRLVSWQKDYQGVMEYILMNQREALGISPYTERKKKKTRPTTQKKPKQLILVF